MREYHSRRSLLNTTESRYRVSICDADAQRISEGKARIVNTIKALRLVVEKLMVSDDSGGWLPLYALN
jgi:hypothetical protein